MGLGECTVVWRGKGKREEEERGMDQRLPSELGLFIRLPGTSSAVFADLVPFRFRRLELPAGPIEPDPTVRPSESCSTFIY